MNKEQLESVAQLLRQQRNHFLQEFRRAEQGLDAIAEERESELEEHAQEEQTARLLTRLDDQTLRAIKEIDAALQKILDGYLRQVRGLSQVDSDRPSPQFTSGPLLQTLRRKERVAADQQPVAHAETPADRRYTSRPELAE